ncbi:MAG TPA: carboxypeptidase-like regulatory domain-containing protein [Microlunatus sp.]
MIINGAVTDLYGRPVVGAAVLIASSPIPVPDIAALTGADGLFSIAVPVPGAYRLIVRSEVDTVEVTVDITAPEAQVVVALSG